jgi:hypothetical protein
VAVAGQMRALVDDMHRMTFLRQLAGNDRAAESGADAEVGFHRASLKFQEAGSSFKCSEESEEDEEDF